MYLDSETLLSCRLVSQSWKRKLDNPYFWMEKCKQRWFPEELKTAWNVVIQKLKDQNNFESFENNITVCLMKTSLNLTKEKMENFYFPLNLASLGGYTNFVQFILENVDSTLRLDHKRENPIHSAAKKGHIDILELLLPYAKSEDFITKSRMTPFHYLAAQPNPNERLDEIVEKIAELQGVNYNMNYIVNYKGSPLFLAAENGHIGMVKCFMRIATSYKYEDLSPIHLAAQNGHTEIVKYLEGLKLCQPQKDYYSGYHTNFTHNFPSSRDEMTPLHFAAMNGHIEIVKFYVDTSENVNHKNTTGYTPFLYAKINGHIEVMEILKTVAYKPETSPKGGCYYNPFSK